MKSIEEKNMIKRFGSSCILLIFLFSSGAFADEASARYFQLGGHGFLELRVPASWKEEVRQPLHNLPPTIRFQPAEENEFLVMVTPLWNLGNLADFNSDRRVKEAVEGDMQEMAAGAAEEKLEIKSIKSANAYGYYFTATDKSPKPGEWKYVLQAGVATGKLLLSVTVLTHERDAPIFTEILDVLRSARHRK
jgi:hypothetical protein